MSSFDELKDSIRDSINHRGLSASGFYIVRCLVCDDHKVRAGWKLEGDTIIYQCFRGRCDATIVYQRGSNPSRKFRKILDAYGITLPADIKLHSINQPKEEVNDNLYEKHSYSSCQLPTYFYPYVPKKAGRIQRWLRSIYGMEDSDYLIGNKEEWQDRLIIPFYLDGKLIGWQGVYYGAGKRQKYRKSSFNTDMLYSPSGRIPNEPILVEGAFDAKSIPDGVATLHSSVSKKQAYLLRNKNPILLPDREGSKYLEVAKRYGWRICIPSWYDKDVNEAMIRYGRMTVARMIHEGICKHQFEAEVKYKLWKIMDL